MESGDNRLIQLNKQVVQLYQGGEYKQAIPLVEDMQEIAREMLGETHPDYATSLNDLAELHRLVGDHAQAEPLFLQALHIYGKALCETYPQYLITLNNLALLYRSKGDFARAESVYLQELEIRSKVLGETHSGYATSLSNLGTLYWLMDKYEQSEPLLSQALEIRRKNLGEIHPDFAASLNNLGTLYTYMRKYTQSEPLLRQGLEIRREILGENHPDYATSLYALANLYHLMDDYTQAQSLYLKALEIRREILGDNHPDYAASLCSLGNLLMSIGDHTQAESQLRQALKIQAKALGENHVDYANTLSALGTLCYWKGDYTQAESLLRQAIEIQSKTLVGKSYLNYGISLTNLAGVLVAQGDYLQAKTLSVQGVDILRKAVGDNHAEYAKAITNLASVHVLIGQYAQAQTLYHQAILIQAQIQDVTHLDTVATFIGLADVYFIMGNYSQAEDFLLDAIDIQLEKQGDRHAALANTLQKLGDIYSWRYNYKEAKVVYEQSLEVTRKSVGEAHPDYSNRLFSLATVCRNIGDYEQAESFYQQSIQHTRKTLSENHRGYDDCLIALGKLYREMGDYSQAESFYRQALVNWEQAKRQADANYFVCLNGLAEVCVTTGKLGEATRLFKYACRNETETISQIVSMCSEDQQAAYTKKVRPSLDIFLSVLVEHPSDFQHTRAAFDLVLSRKAIAAQALLAKHQAVLSGQCPNLESVLKRLRTLRWQIARKTLAGPGAEGSDNHDKTLSEWRGEKDQLDVQLDRQISEMQLEQQLQSVDLRAVAEHIPEDGTLVEFVRFDVYDFNAVRAKGEQQWKSARYIAFVVPAGDSDTVRLIDLGEVAPIDGLIAQFRAQITRDSKEFERRGLLLDEGVKAAEQVPGEALRIHVFDPLRAHLGENHHLYLAPDGELTRLPFEVLPTDEGHLLDNYAISYVGTGRDVLRFGAEASGAASEPVVVADPDFDLSERGTRTDQTLNPAPGESASELTVITRQSRDLSRANMHFSHLPGTRVEGERVAARLGVEPWLDAQALEAPLKGQRSPQILHLATHGFFLENQPIDPNAGDRFRDTISWGDDGSIARFSGPGMENPLLRSGLALAGVNSWLKHSALPAEAEDGLLTAEDVSGLDLLNTELVVLSACETGLGEIHVGEGVFGLRRAFVLAGARTLIMSLWKVPDFVTAILMDRLYENLLERGLPRDESLREAQRYVRVLTVGELHKQWLTAELINQFSAGDPAIARQLKHLVEQPDNHCPFSHPLYWGAFICQGESAPLTLPTYLSEQVSAIDVC